MTNICGTNPAPRGVEDKKIIKYKNEIKSVGGEVLSPKARQRAQERLVLLSKKAGVMQCVAVCCRGVQCVAL